VLLLIPTYILVIFLRSKINETLDFNNVDIHKSFSRTRVSEDGILEVILDLTNNSTYNTHIVEFVDFIPSSFDLIEGTNVFILDLKKEESLTLKYKVKCNKIGIFEFNSIALNHNDFFGLIRRSYYYFFPELETITVTPKYEKFDKLPIFTYWIKYFNGYFVSKQFGEDSDFRGVKEYQYGDKLQHINWKASSKYQNTGSSNLYSNTFSYDNALEFEILFDLTYESYSVFTESMRIITTLAEYILRTRNKLGLTIAKQYPERVKSKVGMKQHTIMIDRLLKTKTDEKPNEEILVDRLLNISKSYNRKSIVLIITPLLNRFILKFCLQMKQNNFNVILIQPDALLKQISNISIDKKIIRNFKDSPLFHNLISFDLLFERQMTSSKIISSGIPLLNWKLNTPVSNIFYKTKIMLV
jgi:uncharacterized protein (DUF58 family)